MAHRKMGFCGSDEDAMSVRAGVFSNECFVDVLNIIPHAFLLLVCTFILTVLNHSETGKVKVRAWVHFQGHNMRWIVTLILMVVLIFEVAEGVISDTRDEDSINYHAFIPQCVALLGALISIVYYHNIEMWNSPRFLLALLIYWPCALTLKIIRGLALHKNDLTSVHLKVWLCWMVVSIYVILLFVEIHTLRCQRYAFFPNSRRLKPPDDLEQTRYVHSYCNLLSRAVFWWVSELMVQGYRHALEEEDLGTLPETDRAAHQFRKLKSCFEGEKHKADLKKREPSLTKSWLSAFWPMLMLAGLYKLLGDLFSFVGPVTIEYIVDYAYDIKYGQTESLSFVGNNSMPRDQLYVTVSKFLWNGYVLCVALFLSSILQHTFLQNHHYLVIREGIRLRSAIQAMVYNKALRLSSLVISSSSMTVGQILNHMTVDPTFLMFMIFFIHYLWAIPFEVVATLLLMYLKLGVSAVIGGSLVVLAAPAMYGLGVILARIQKRVLVQSDRRVKKVNELVQGIKVIKLLAWEDLFTSEVLHTRNLETRLLLVHSAVRSFIAFIGMSAPTIGAMITFLIYPYLENTPLTAGRALSTLALFNLLSTPLQILTLFAATFTNAKVSTGRLIPYFMAPEVEGMWREMDKTRTHSIGVDTQDGEAIKLGDIVFHDNHTGEGEGELTKHELYSSMSSLGSVRTPTHSRTNSGASLKDMLENKRLSFQKSTPGDLLELKQPQFLRKVSAPMLHCEGIEGGRRRHASNVSNISVSTDDEDGSKDEVITVVRKVVEVDLGNFSWNLDGSEPFLKDISIYFPAGKLTVIVGAVGSGKSSLLAAVLGEMVTTSGVVEWDHSDTVAFVSQTAWLLNGTIRNNILFGHPFVWRRYKRVLEACSLNADLEQFPAGDQTEIGEKGISLSGGQKQRVAIARALYANASTVILDDPLSALDAQVGKHVFESAIWKRLIKRKRTVILVTHQLQYVSYAAQVIVMKDGCVHYCGKVSEVKKVDPDLYESWRKAIKEAKTAELRHSFDTDTDRKHPHTLMADVGRPPSVQSQLSVPGFGRKASVMSVMTEASNENDSDSEDRDLPKKGSSAGERGQLIVAEHRETGAVDAKVYLRYIKACSIMMCLLTLAANIFYHVLVVLSNFILSVWSSESSLFLRNFTDHNGNNATVPMFNNEPFMKEYAAWSVSAIFVALLSTFILYYTTLYGARRLYQDMLCNLVHAPMRFFDTNPSGRILNRFSADVTAIDQRLAMNLEGLLRSCLFAVSAIIVNTIGTPYFLIAAVPLIILYYFLQRFFRCTARELQRLDSITKSPVFSHFTETLNGLQTIRAFRLQKKFFAKALSAIDKNVTPFLFLHTTNRWLGIRLDYLSSLLVFVSAVASLTAGVLGKTDPAFIGLSITYALMISGYLNWIVRQGAEVEMNMNAVERVLEYTHVESEPTIEKSAKSSLSEKWPSKGDIEYRHVTLRYDVGLDPVVFSASFSIKGGERIGVCGRTGSGKTSLSLSLFRLLEIVEGEILIDGVDIKTVPLPRLRSSLAIIPQEPVLFNGSIRYNLDPDGKTKTEDIWRALDVVQMRETIAALPEELEYQVAEGGENFSVGQRQLFCLARAFLRDCHILVLDEATASVDIETDRKLQAVIADQAFQNRTILTIAHRMSTIVNYDRVMVMERGRIVEIDSPRSLMTRQHSVFSTLVEEAKKTEEAKTAEEETKKDEASHKEETSHLEAIHVEHPRTTENAKASEESIKTDKSPKAGAKKSEESGPH